jgi:hypothetical protein
MIIEGERVNRKELTARLSAARKFIARNAFIVTAVSE